MGKVDEMAEEKVEASGAPDGFQWPDQTLTSYDYVLEMAQLNGFDNVTKAIITAVAARAPNTRQRAERAARRMDGLSLISTTLNTVEHRIQQVADIIAAEFES